MVVAIPVDGIYPTTPNTRHAVQCGNLDQAVGYPESGSHGCPCTTERSTSQRDWPCCRAVWRYPRSVAKRSAPLELRNDPEMCWRTFNMRKARSARLLVKGTVRSSRNRSVASRSRSRRSTKFRVLVWAGRRRVPGAGNFSGFCFNPSRIKVSYRSCKVARRSGATSDAPAARAAWAASFIS